MSDNPEWLPPLLRLQDFNGNWQKYIDAVFAIFYRDFLENRAHFSGKPVACRGQPLVKGKEEGFWHCVSEGPFEDQRLPDLRRCESIPWIKAILSQQQAPEVQVWYARKRREMRAYVWYREEYLIVLGVRKSYFQLITAFCTDRAHTRKRLRAQRDAARKS